MKFSRSNRVQIAGKAISTSIYLTI